METVKISSAVQTKAETASGRIKSAGKPGDFVKLLQQKEQTAGSGESRTKTAGAALKKPAKTDDKAKQIQEKLSGQKNEDWTEELAEDLTVQEILQMSAAQIISILPEEPETAADSGNLTEEQSIVFDFGVTQILAKNQQDSGIPGSAVQIEKSQAADPVPQTAEMNAPPALEPSGEVVPEPRSIPAALSAAKGIEETGKPASENTGETGKHLAAADPGRPEEAAAADEIQDRRTLRDPLKAEDPAGNRHEEKEVPEYRGKELSPGPVEKTDERAGNGIADSGSDRMQTLQEGIRSEEGAGKTAALTSIAPQRQEDEKPESNGLQHLAYRSDSLQEHTGGMHEVFKTEPVHLKTTHTDIPQDLGKTLASKLPGSGKEMVIELEPASLGKLTIKLTYEAGKAAVSILSTNPRTLEILSQKASEIAAILEEKTGQETIIYTHAPEQQEEQEPDQNQGGGRQQQEENSQKDSHQDQHQAESFMQQLRLGLI